MGADELADPSIPLENLIWRLFNEEQEVRAQGGVDFVRGGRSGGDYIVSVLAKFSDEEHADTAEDGVITVDCAFCAQKFPIAVDALN